MNRLCAWTALVLALVASWPADAATVCRRTGPDKQYVCEQKGSGWLTDALLGKRGRRLVIVKAAIGEAIAQGRCDDARDIALKAGLFDIAKDVDGLCKPIPSVP